NAAIAYCNPHAVAAHVEVDLDTAAGWAELTRIEDQIHQDLSQSSAVSHQSDARSADLEALAFASQERLYGEAHIGQQLRHIQRLASQIESAGRGHHQVVDKHL